jgi:uncharacterized protein involved in outer membrane biogenesis
MKLKWILTGVAAVVVALVVAGYVALSSLDLDELREVVQAEAKKATGRDLVVSGPIDLAISLTPAVAVEGVSFANADWGSQPQMAKIDRFEIELELLPLISGEYRVKRLVLIGADLLFETKADGTGNWAFETADAPAQSAGAEGEAANRGAMKLPEIDRVSIEDSRLTYRDGRSGEALVLGVEELSLTAKGETLAVGFEGSYQDEKIELSGELGALGRLVGGGDYPVSLKGEVAEAELEIVGSLRDVASAPKPDLRFSLAGDSLAAFNSLAGAELPPLGPYSLSGRLTGDGKTFNIEGLSAKVENSDLAGDLSVALGGKRPKVTASLNAALLNLADFQGEDESAEAETGGQKAGDDKPAAKAARFVIPDTPLPLAALGALDAEVTAKVGVLRLQEGLEATDVALTLALTGGNLAIAPLSAGFSGGAIDGDIRLDGSKRNPPVAIKLTVDDLDYGRLLKERELSEDMEGLVDIDLDLAGSGVSPRAIASSLNGRTDVVGEKGVITNKILAVVASGLGEVLGPLFGGKEETTLNCVVSRFAIKDGVATSEVQLLDSATFSLAGGGTFDLRDESLDLAFDTETRQAALVSLAIPFRVTGTLAKPSVAPDPMGTAMSAAKVVGSVANPLAALGALAGQQAISGATSEEAANPCLAALSGTASAPAAQGATEEPAQGAAGQPATSPIEDTAKGAGDAVKGVTDEVGKTLKGLFGN